MDHLISMYIDNELDLDEKIRFLDHVSGSSRYKNDAVALLEQEKLLHGAINKTAPVTEKAPSRSRLVQLFSSPSLGWAVAACLLLMVSFFVTRDFNPQNRVAVEPATVFHRFVVHQENTRQMEITGSFTNWQRVPLVPTGTKGYWEISLPVSAGEHRYTFIVDGSKFLPDPTVAAQESDDFGTTNSILNTGA
ncbi:MAG: glycogen-binding domain-containing protein [Desulfobulbaceae bacterium]|nr:glycogen-binding domain-containing protein [Desulfobulbaceae bacterium]